MRATFKSFRLCGNVDAPPSKSMAHRYLICAALSGEKCRISGVDFSEDILASIDCLRALGVKIVIENDMTIIDSKGFMKNLKNPVLDCRESGSTLRFFIPLALCLGQDVHFKGSERLFERPLTVYEEICKEQHFVFTKDRESLTLNGNLKSSSYKVRGDISSQFITGLIFALVYLGEEACIEIIPPFESRSYVKLTVSALNSFGADVEFTDDYHIVIRKAKMQSYEGRIEGDYSNAAVLDAFNYIGSDIKLSNLKSESLQGDRVYKAYFEKLDTGTPTLDISDCPDLGPVLIALAALKHGATFTGTDRLKIKESDRGAAMQEELKKLGGELVFAPDSIRVPKQKLAYKDKALWGHNDHRIVMAMSLILSVTGGVMEGTEVVRKSYPDFFEELHKLGANIEFSMEFSDK